MSFFPRLLGFSRKMSGSLCLSVFVFFSIGNAQAITIDFDDLNPADFVGDGWYIPLTNQYESLGVLFEGYVNPVAASTKSAPNFLHGSIGISIYFLDTLPTHVSMYVGSLLEHKVGIRAHGANGYFEDWTTDGEVRGMNWESSTPYRPDQFVSFYIPEGITSINIGGQADSYIDDLTFGVSVSEPGIFLLFSLGLLMTYLHRKRLQ